MNWGCQWEMDGCQWFVLKIDLYEPTMYNDVHVGREGTYNDNIKFIYDHLLPNVYSKIKINMHCPECTHILHESDIKYIMNHHFPEEMI